MVCFILNWQNWIQSVAALMGALAAIGLVVLTFLTLLVLRDYAADTKRIANDSSSQVERSQMPFLALIWKRNETGRTEYSWYLQNQGFGPALNISRTSHFTDKTSSMSWVAPLAPKADHNIDGITGGQIRAHEFRAEYESLSGKKYRTTVKWADEQMFTQFDVLS